MISHKSGADGVVLPAVKGGFLLPLARLLRRVPVHIQNKSTHRMSKTETSCVKNDTSCVKIDILYVKIDM